MAKNRLEISYDFAFHLVALNTSVKEYKLAWSLNRELQLDLTKKDNISIDFSKGKPLAISNYICEKEYQTFRLLRNRSENFDNQINAYLIPELKNFDYFLMVADDSTTFDINPFISTIKQIPFVQFAVTVDTAVLRSKDNLIF